MRLRIVGPAFVAAGLGWLSCANALTDLPRSSGAPVASTDAFVMPASGFTSTDIANFQADLMSPPPRDQGAQRIHLATAAPIVTERTATSQAQAALAAAAFASSTTDRPPSAWLMIGVTLLLIGYQLRRKHRLLRPHRFHRI
jgi:4-hydroxybenzoate polyprenyltransferase